MLDKKFITDYSKDIATLAEGIILCGKTACAIRDNARKLELDTLTHVFNDVNLYLETAFSSMQEVLRSKSKKSSQPS